MRPTDLDNVAPGLRLGAQRPMQPFECGDQVVGDGAPRRDVEGGREAVVRRLALVDMVVGMDGALSTALPGQDLVGAGSAERRVGKEIVSTRKSRWSLDDEKKNKLYQEIYT